MLSWKLAPALAMGNTVVLKPGRPLLEVVLLFRDSDHSAFDPPVSLPLLRHPQGDWVAAGGCQRHHWRQRDGELPCCSPVHQQGSLSLPLATSRYLSLPLAASRCIIRFLLTLLLQVAFTGSTSVGKQIRKQLAGRDVKLTMELGGKSAMIVLQDADLDACVEGCVDSIFMNQGQVCCAGSRLLVQEGVKDKLVAKLKERIERLRMGNSLDKNADMAAINNTDQLRSISTFVEEGKKEGGEIFQSNLSFNPS